MGARPGVNSDGTGAYGSGTGSGTGEGNGRVLYEQLDSIVGKDGKVTYIVTEHRSGQKPQYYTLGEGQRRNTYFPTQASSATGYNTEAAKATVKAAAEQMHNPPPSEKERLSAYFRASGERVYGSNSVDAEYYGRDAAAAKLLQMKSQGLADYSWTPEGRLIVTYARDTSKSVDEQTAENFRAMDDKARRDWSINISPFSTSSQPEKPYGIDPIVGANINPFQTPPKLQAEYRPMIMQGPKAAVKDSPGGGRPNFLESFLGLSYEESGGNRLGITSERQYNDLPFWGKVAASKKSSLFWPTDAAEVAAANADYGKQLAAKAKSDAEVSGFFNLARANEAGAKVTDFQGGYPTLTFEGKTVSPFSSKDALDDMEKRIKADNDAFGKSIEEYHTARVQNAQGALNWMAPGVPGDVKTFKVAGGLAVTSLAVGALAASSGGAALAAGYGVPGMVLGSSASVASGLGLAVASDKYVRPKIEENYDTLARFTTPGMILSVAEKATGRKDLVSSTKPVGMFFSDVVLGSAAFAVGGGIGLGFTRAVAGENVLRSVKSPKLFEEELGVKIPSTGQSMPRRVASYSLWRKLPTEKLNSASIKPKQIVSSTEKAGSFMQVNRLSKTPYKMVQDSVAFMKRNIGEEQNWVGRLNVKGERASWMDSANAKINKLFGAKYEAPSFKQRLSFESWVKQGTVNEPKRTTIGKMIKEEASRFYSNAKDKPKLEVGRTLNREKLVKFPRQTVKPEMYRSFDSTSSTIFEDLNTKDMFLSTAKTRRHQVEPKRFLEFSSGKTTSLGKVERTEEFDMRTWIRTSGSPIGKNMVGDILTGAKAGGRSGRGILGSGGGSYSMGGKASRSMGLSSGGGSGGRGGATMSMMGGGGVSGGGGAAYGFAQEHAELNPYRGMFDYENIVKTQGKKIQGAGYGFADVVQPDNIDFLSYSNEGVKLRRESVNADGYRFNVAGYEDLFGVKTANKDKLEHKNVFQNEDLFGNKYDLKDMFKQTYRGKQRSINDLVGLKNANRLGLEDISGNKAENKNTNRNSYKDRYPYKYENFLKMGYMGRGGYVTPPKYDLAKIAFPFIPLPTVGGGSSVSRGRGSSFRRFKMHWDLPSEAEVLGTLTGQLNRKYTKHTEKMGWDDLFTLPKPKKTKKEEKKEKKKHHKDRRLRLDIGGGFDLEDLL